MCDLGDGAMRMHNNSFYGIQMLWWTLIILFLFVIMLWGIRTRRKSKYTARMHEKCLTFAFSELSSNLFTTRSGRSYKKERPSNYPVIAHNNLHNGSFKNAQAT